MSGQMVMRCRGPSSQATLSGLSPGMTLRDWQQLLQDKTGVPVQRQEILTGFPPAVLQVRHCHSIQ